MTRFNYYCTECQEAVVNDLGTWLACNCTTRDYTSDEAFPASWKKKKEVSFKWGDNISPLINMTDKPSSIQLDVSGMLYEFGNAEIYDAESAEYVRSNAEAFASTVSRLLEELDETEIPEVRQILEKYNVIL